MTNENEFAGYAALYRRAVESLRDGRFDAAEFAHVNYLNEILSQETGFRMQDSGDRSPDPGVRIS